ncbi:integral membrane metal-binding family protein [Perilla frutescens var. frutescens]|nr:integral membrane metal-binding family protein [Perilla frutescens var. frutescens]
MAGESKNEKGESVTSTDTEIKKTKKKKGVISRLWGAIFRVRGDDFEKRLQHISKEEASVLARITRRSHSWRRTTRQFIVLSVVSEAIAVGCAIMTTRSLDLNWHMRALRVLPMFLLPVLCFITYSALSSFTKMRDSKDHKTLENLRAERQAKINELKEKTNYYTTQQLIERYDPDPAAKAAAATVLASKLGADSGLKVYVGDDSNPKAPAGKSNDVEFATTTGLRNRKQYQSKNSSMESGFTDLSEEGMRSPTGVEGVDVSQQHPMVVEHHSHAGPNSHDGGWIARLAALLVGEDPTQSYALICGNCHMHNGLARKEDFPYITYYCPHCNALNRPKQVEDHLSGSTSPTLISRAEVVPSEGGSTVDNASSTSSPVATDAADISES